MDTSTGILIFTEHPASGKALQGVLAKLGFSRVAVAAQPHEAIKALASGGMGLVVIDHAPGSSLTASLIRALRDVERFKHILLLLLAEPGEKALAAFAQKDANALFVAKPLAAKPFADGLRQILEGSRQPARPAQAAQPAQSAAPRPAQPQTQPAAAPAPRPSPVAAPGPVASPAAGQASGLSVTIQDLAKLLKARKTVEVAALAESMLKTQCTRADLHLALALARLLSGDQARCQAALDALIANCQGDAPPPRMEAEATPTGELRGVWSALSLQDRRQKAFEHFAPTHDKRAALRLFVPDWTLGAQGLAGRLQIVDLSFGGCCAEAPRPALERGAELVVDLYRGKDKVVEGVKASILRVEADVVGCRFHDMSRQQENQLNQLLREEQTKGAVLSTEFEGAGKKEKKVIKLSL